MSPIPSTTQAAINKLTAQIEALETDVQAKIIKGRGLRGAFATKHDTAVVSDLHKKLASLVST